jgi:hypothetical protein
MKKDAELRGEGSGRYVAVTSFNVVEVLTAPSPTYKELDGVGR